MNCDKCHKEAVSLYGVPGHAIGRMMPNPRAPRYCYECYVEDYGTDEAREELAKELAIDKSIDADIDHARHGV